MSIWDRQRKAIAGADYAFRFLARDGYVTSGPTLTVRWPAPVGDKVYTLLPLRAADPITAIDGGSTTGARRQLTLTVTTSLATTMRGGIGEHGGHAWVDGGASYQGPVRLAKVVSDGPPSAVVELAEPLRHDATVVGTWTLYHMGYAVTIPANDVGTDVLRHVRWFVDWTRKTGTDSPARVDREHGLLRVILAPFDTGLDDEDLYRMVPHLAEVVPRRQSSWEPQRQHAQLLLEQALEPRLPAGRYLDDLLGEQFRLVHAYMTAVEIMVGMRGAQIPRDLIDLYQARATAGIESVLAKPFWLDADADGAIDEGETDGDLTDFSGLALTSATDAEWDEDAFDRIGEEDDR